MERMLADGYNFGGEQSGISFSSTITRPVTG